MLQGYLYIHLDGMSNSVLSKGMSHADYNRYTISRPRNLLLLNPYEREGEYEPHTGFRVIRGDEQVEKYFTQLENRYTQDIKWLDFKDYEVLKRLTANEISELLYFGHMKNQLRSPFFFKLQNNYAFFTVGRDTLKIYYRNIDEFYHVISQKITTRTLEQINSNKAFFARKKKEISPMEMSLVSELRSVMQEGVVFDFSQQGLQDDVYHIPVHVVEDNLRKLEQQPFRYEEQIGTLRYHDLDGTWHFEKEELLN